jgi:hypothetical protein
MAAGDLPVEASLAPYARKFAINGVLARVTDTSVDRNSDKLPPLPAGGMVRWGLSLYADVAIRRAGLDIVT